MEYLKEYEEIKLEEQFGQRFTWRENIIVKWIWQSSIIFDWYPLMEWNIPESQENNI